MRRVFRIFLAVLWLGVVLLAAELGARLYDLWLRHDNAFIAAEQNKTPFPGRVERLETARPFVLEGEPPWETWPVVAPTSFTYRSDETPEMTLERHRQFSALDEHSRRVAAFLHCELVVHLIGDAGEGLEPVAVYGAYHAEEQMHTSIVGIRPGSEHPVLRVVAGKVDSAVGPAPLPPQLGALRADYVAAEDGVFAFLPLRRAEYLQLLLTPYEAPPDSPWKIPFVRYKPDQTGTTTLGAAFTTNNLGLRDEPTEIPKPRGRFRILCMGGSTTEEGPSNDRTYPNLLEDLLAVRFTAEDIEVVNGGVSGMTLFSHHLRLPDYLAMSPDLAVLYLGINDIARKYLPESVPALLTPLAGSEALRRTAPGLLYPWNLDSALNDEVMPHYEALCQAFLANGIPVVLCTFAMPDPALLDKEEAVYYDYCARTWPPQPYALAFHVQVMRAFNGQVRLLARRLDMPLVPVAELMRGGSEYYGDICHMRDAGIVRKAAIIGAYVAPMIDDYFKHTARAGNAS